MHLQEIEPSMVQALVVAAVVLQLVMWLKYNIRWLVIRCVNTLTCNLTIACCL